ncbi:PREDICTED: unnamed product [Prunus dulcis]|uniref:PREDICTED: unnamed product n=2 Tax=Prunus dulcis TaxID=3755 RepID=A0A5E4ECB2_PRUDU|nr:PREDICTED: unnamed product [Prunus dulcis]
MGGPCPKSLIFPQFPKQSLNLEIWGLILFLVVVVVVLPLPTTATAVSPSSSIYDHLRQQGLPMGILPKGITEYSLNGSTGEFRVLLAQPCHAKFENQVLYDFNVSGVLSFGRIANLSGVSAQELFLWFPVKGIRVDVPSSGLIYFDVGVVDKQFSLSLFESPPDCTAVDPSDPNFNPAAHHTDHYSHSPSGSSSKIESQNLGDEVSQKSELRASS